jgi:hypothetical protein
MDKFGFVDKELGVIAIPYEFGEWSSDVVYPYYVGEITEEPSITEDGAEQSTLILTGFHRGKRIDLERGKEKIKKHFHPIYGLRGNTDSGVIAVFFDGSFYIPTGEADLKKIEIHLKIKEWKGDL